MWLCFLFFCFCLSWFPARSSNFPYLCVPFNQWRGAARALSKTHFKRNSFWCNINSSRCRLVTVKTDEIQIVQHTLANMLPKVHGGIWINPTQFRHFSDNPICLEIVLNPLFDPKTIFVEVYRISQDNNQQLNYCSLRN